MSPATIVLLLIACTSPLQGYRSYLVVYAIKVSCAYQLLKPYLSDIAYYAEKTEYWEYSRSNLKELIIAYYRRAYDLIKVNKIEEASYYLAVSLSLLIDLIPHNYSLKEVVVYIKTVDLNEVTVLEGSVEEILSYAENTKPKNPREYSIVYLSTALSLVNKLPLSAFERLLFTPVLREMFIASIIFTALLFSILLRKKARFEGVGIEYEKLP